MIIVSGRIQVKTGARDAFLAASHAAIVAARATPGCHDFVVAPDPLESNRVNVYEEWETTADLERFRGNGPGPDLTLSIDHADVSRHQVPPRAHPDAPPPSR